MTIFVAAPMLRTVKVNVRRMNKQTYYVRPGFVLHKKSFTNARLTTQVFSGGETIELTEPEAHAYAHLIETKENVTAREKGGKKS